MTHHRIAKAETSWSHLDRALRECDAALKLEPRYADALIGRGIARLRLGQLDPAIADFDAALRLQPKFAWALQGKGLALRRKGESARGDADIKAAAAINPEIAKLAAHYRITE